MKKYLYKIIGVLACVTLFCIPVVTFASLTTNIKGYWKLDESAGDAADSSGNGFTMTNTGTVTYGTGIINNGAIFANSTQQLANSSNILATGDTSYNMWVKLSSEITSNFYTFTFFNRGTSGYEYVRYGYNGGTPRLNASNSDISPITYNITLGTSAWHMVTFTRNASTGDEILYVNGVSVATTNENSPFNQAGSQIIGTPGAGSGNFLVGTIDEVGVWSRILTGAEVTQLYNSGAGLQYPFGNSSFSADCTGGTITHVGGNTIHTFTGNGTFDCTGKGIGNVNYVLIGGGGQGGSAWRSGAGGGAGQFISNPVSFSGSSAVVIGAGGTGITVDSSVGNPGGSTTWDGLTAVGGTGGASKNARNSSNAGNASSGGGSESGAANIGTAGTGVFHGGIAVSGASGDGGGGGGGSSANGGNAVDSSGRAGGLGGLGTSSSISGASVTYACGGGGGGDGNAVAHGGCNDGSGNGGYNNGSNVGPTAGTANTGGGGGGSGGNNPWETGTDGGSGVAIISYPTPTALSFNVLNMFEF